MNSLASCILETENERAYKLYEKALKLDPSDFETNFNMGLFFYSYRKDHVKAIEYLKQGHDYEHNSTALYNIAYIYEEKGDLENA